MKNLNVNEWMEMDLIMADHDYIVVYAENEDEWWILTSRANYFDAMVALTEWAEDEDNGDDNGDGEYLIVNRMGEIIRG